MTTIRLVIVTPGLLIVDIVTPGLLIVAIVTHGLLIVVVMQCYQWNCLESLSSIPHS